MQHADEVRQQFTLVQSSFMVTELFECQVFEAFEASIEIEKRRKFSAAMWTLLTHD